MAFRLAWRDLLIAAKPWRLQQAAVLRVRCCRWQRLRDRSEELSKQLLRWQYNGCNVSSFYVPFLSILEYRLALRINQEKINTLF
jgi:hypothetical protein